MFTVILPNTFNFFSRPRHHSLKLYCQWNVVIFFHSVIIALYTERHCGIARLSLRYIFILNSPSGSNTKIQTISRLSRYFCFISVVRTALRQCTLLSKVNIIMLIWFGPVARVGPTGAGPRQKSLGPRQKISLIMFKSNTFLRYRFTLYIGYSLYYEPDTGWIYYDFSVQMNRRNVTFSLFVSNQGCKIASKNVKFVRF